MSKVAPEQRLASLLSYMDARSLSGIAMSCTEIRDLVQAVAGGGSWSRSHAILAQELGCSYSTVQRDRRRYSDPALVTHHMGGEPADVNLLQRISGGASRVVEIAFRRASTPNQAVYEEQLEHALEVGAFVGRRLPAKHELDEEQAQRRRLAREYERMVDVGWEPEEAADQIREDVRRGAYLPVDNPGEPPLWGWASSDDAPRARVVDPATAGSTTCHSNLRGLRGTLRGAEGTPDAPEGGSARPTGPAASNASRERVCSLPEQPGIGDSPEAARCGQPSLGLGARQAGSRSDGVAEKGAGRSNRGSAPPPVCPALPLVGSTGPVGPRSERGQGARLRRRLRRGARSGFCEADGSAPRGGARRPRRSKVARELAMPRYRSMPAVAGTTDRREDEAQAAVLRARLVAMKVLHSKPVAPDWQLADALGTLRELYGSRHTAARVVEAALSSGPPYSRKDSSSFPGYAFFLAERPRLAVRSPWWLHGIENGWNGAKPYAEMPGWTPLTDPAGLTLYEDDGELGPLIDAWEADEEKRREARERAELDALFRDPALGALTEWAVRSDRLCWTALTILEVAGGDMLRTIVRWREAARGGSERCAILCSQLDWVVNRSLPGREQRANGDRKMPVRGRELARLMGEARKAREAQEQEANVARVGNLTLGIGFRL